MARTSLRRRAAPGAAPPRREAFVSADAQLVDYEADIYGNSQAQFYQLGVGGRLWPDLLTLKISVSYAQDPYYDEDASAILSLILDP